MRYIAGIILLVVILISINRLFFGDDIVGYSITENPIDNESKLSPTPTINRIIKPTVTQILSPSPTSTAIPLAVETPIPIPTPTLVPITTLIPIPTQTPIPNPIPTPTATPIITPLPTPDPSKYGPSLEAINISLENNEITTVLVVDSYSSTVIESVLYIKNPFGENISVGCSPFKLTSGVEICSIKFKPSEEFLSYKGKYIFERIFLKNSNNIQSNYWGDGRLQKGQSFPIENNAHKYLSTIIGFTKD